VTALDTGISMNTFYGDPGLNSFVRKLFRAPYRDHFRYWILNIVEQNRHCQSFPKILSRYRIVTYRAEQTLPILS
jgi:hypothetical protein